MILSNITATASTATALLSLQVSILPDPKSSVGYFPAQSRSGTCAAPVPYPAGEPQDVLALPLLVDAFIQGAGVDDENDPDKRLRKANLHFLSSVFANISIVSLRCAVPQQAHYVQDTFWEDVFPDSTAYELTEARRGFRISSREIISVH